MVTWQTLDHLPLNNTDKVYKALPCVSCIIITQQGPKKASGGFVFSEKKKPCVISTMDKPSPDSTNYSPTFSTPKNWVDETEYIPADLPIICVNSVEAGKKMLQAISKKPYVGMDFDRYFIRRWMRIALPDMEGAYLVELFRCPELINLLKPFLEDAEVKKV